MINKSVILQKFEKLDFCLKRIQDTVNNDLSSFDHLAVQETFILNLQRASQIVIDCAAHIIKDNKLGLPTTIKEYFTVLAENSSISQVLADKLRKMVGFRNIAVHDYESLNLEILKSIYKSNLIDFNEFKREIIDKLS